MTRKDYILIAETIRSVIDDIERETVATTLSDRGRAVLAGERMGARSVAMRLAARLRSESDHFEVGRFLDAAMGPVV